MHQEIAQFLEFLQRERNSTKNTIAAYNNDLNQFRDVIQRIVAQHGGVSEQMFDALTSEILEAYVLHLRKNDYATSTIARKIAAVKGFCQYLVQEGILTDDPSSELNSPKVERSPPKLISHRDITLLLNAPGENDAPKGQRDKALLELLYSTGMRVTELISLNTADYNIAARTIICGLRDPRTIAIQREVAAYLNKYVNDGRVKLLNAPNEDALFLNHRGQRLTRQGLWLILKKYAKQIGISADVTPHTLRHSFAAHLIDSGVELKDVQHRLGHANISTTQTYQHSIKNVPKVIVDGKPVNS